MTNSAAEPNRVYLYDTTLRDGLGMEGLSLSVEDKVAIAQRLDELGVDYVEGGYPGSNPKDAEFFDRMRETPLRNAKLVAFGSTRRAGGDAATDPALTAVLNAETPAVTLVGKSSAEQVREVLTGYANTPCPRGRRSRQQMPAGCSCPTPMGRRRGKRSPSSIR